MPFPRYRIRVRHLVSPFDVTGSPVPKADRQWTWCGRLLYHVEPIPKTGPVCKVCERAQRARCRIKGCTEKPMRGSFCLGRHEDGKWRVALFCAYHGLQAVGHGAQRLAYRPGCDIARSEVAK